jgi:hypothetical protein
MNKKYLKIFVGIIVALWVVYILQIWYEKSGCRQNCSKCGKNNCNCRNRCPDCPNNQEGFTSGLRPYIRNINQQYDSLVSNYGVSALAHKFQKWNIYG